LRKKGRINAIEISEIERLLKLNNKLHSNISNDDKAVMPKFNINNMEKYFLYSLLNFAGPIVLIGSKIRAFWKPEKKSKTEKATEYSPYILELRILARKILRIKLLTE
jgi:hypothetical protein